MGLRGARGAHQLGPQGGDLAPERRRLAVELALAALAFLDGALDGFEPAVDIVGFRRSGRQAAEAGRQRDDDRRRPHPA